jgi:hypothetical protein
MLVVPVSWIITNNYKIFMFSIISKSDIILINKERNINIKA